MPCRFKPLNLGVRFGVFAEDRKVEGSMREERGRGLKEGRTQDTGEMKSEVGEVLGVGSLSGHGVREKGEVGRKAD